MTGDQRWVAALLAAACSLAPCFAGCGSEAPPVEYRTLKELPQDFPADIPIYPKATVTAAVTANGKAAVVVWETSDRLPVVQQYYTNWFTENGWTVTKQPGLPAPWMGDDGLIVYGTRRGRRLGIGLGEKGEEGERTAIIVAFP